MREPEYLLTSQEAKKLDSISIQDMGIPSLVLMERAALALAEEIEKDQRIDKASHILIVSGVGNNGADGLAAARILLDLGFVYLRVIAVGIPEKATNEWNCQKRILEKLGIPVTFWNDSEAHEYTDIEEADLIVDALFGIGLKREVSGSFAAIIGRINSSQAVRYAVDIPSGICATTGAVLGCAVKAHVTVTFGFRKAGLVLYPGAEYAGRLVCRSIGFPSQAMRQISFTRFTYTQENMDLIPRRPAYSNKGTFGRVLVIAGSFNMAGAAYLASLAAYAGGCGLVRILTDEANRPILQTLLPEAIMSTYSGENLDKSQIVACIRWAQVIIMGPGLSTSKTAEQLVKLTLDTAQVPMVVDADALNILAQYPAWWGMKKAPIIATPHLGEMSRLSGVDVDTLKQDLPSHASALQKRLQVTLVAKDARTVVAGSGQMIYINTSGNSGMAKAGSGDVLAGIIGAMLAMKLEPMQAACLGVYLHGLAGDRARDIHGEYGMRASDLAEAFREILKEYARTCQKDEVPILQEERQKR